MTTRINNLYAEILKHEMEREDKRLKKIRELKAKHMSMVNVSIEEAKKFPSMYEVDEEKKVVYLKGYKDLKL